MSISGRLHYCWWQHTTPDENHSDNRDDEQTVIEIDWNEEEEKKVPKPNWNQVTEAMSILSHCHEEFVDHKTFDNFQKALFLHNKKSKKQPKITDYFNKQ